MIRIHFQIIEELGRALYGHNRGWLDSISLVRGLHPRLNARSRVSTSRFHRMIRSCRWETAWNIGDGCPVSLFVLS